jgi:hypothetical protein
MLKFRGKCQKNVIPPTESVIIGKGASVLFQDKSDGYQMYSDDGDAHEN